jgi:hypothetical protein
VSVPLLPWAARSLAYGLGLPHAGGGPTDYRTQYCNKEEFATRVCVVEEQERAVDELEQKLQEREVLDDLRLERELAGLATHESSLESREATLVAKQKDFEDSCASVLARELAADIKESALDTRAAEVADREKWLVEQQMQELAAAQKRLEDLQAVHAGEAQKVWDFLGQAESALVPFCFSPRGSGVPAQEVSAEPPLLDSADVKMSELEDVVSSRPGAEAIAEHVLMCFRNQDPHVSLEPVLQGPIEEVLEAAQVSVRETAKLVAEWFEHQPKDV